MALLVCTFPTINLFSLNHSAYSQSKQADRMLSVGYARRLAQSGVIVNSCNPGTVRTKVAMEVEKMAGRPIEFKDSAAEAARAPILLASSAKLENVSGKYFEYEEEKPEQYAGNTALIDELFVELEKTTHELRAKYATATSIGA